MLSQTGVNRFTESVVQIIAEIHLEVMTCV